MLPPMLEADDTTNDQFQQLKSANPIIEEASADSPIKEPPVPTEAADSTTSVVSRPTEELAEL